MRRALVRGGRHYCPAHRIANGEGLVQLTMTASEKNGKRVETYTCPIEREDYTCDHVDDAVS